MSDEGKIQKVDLLLTLLNQTSNAEHISYIFGQGSHCLKYIEQSMESPTSQEILLQVAKVDHITSTMHTTRASL